MDKPPYDRLPIIKILVYEEEKISQVDIKEDPSFFCRFKGPDEYIWCDYDYPGTHLSFYHKGKLTQQIEFNGILYQELVIESFNQDGHPTGSSLYYFKEQQEDWIWQILIDRPIDDIGQIQLCKRRIAKKIFPGDTFKSQEILYEKNERISFPIDEKIDGPFLVHVGNSKSICFRWLLLASYKNRSHITETYFSIPDGKIFLFRRFNNKAFDNYEDLYDSPILKIDEEEYRLWYSSLVFRD
ncbi:MAG: hypothetical protein JXA60_09805 [Candidatus Coatesbacteria bacterium]|nr:hypothetical protein [Candidatus Coatesbacteria bacterium]